jgi:hypothetical protein
MLEQYAMTAHAVEVLLARGAKTLGPALSKALDARCLPAVRCLVQAGAPSSCDDLPTLASNYADTGDEGWLQLFNVALAAHCSTDTKPLLQIQHTLLGLLSPSAQADNILSVFTHVLLTCPEILRMRQLVSLASMDGLQFEDFDVEFVPWLFLSTPISNKVKIFSPNFVKPWGE